MLAHGFEISTEGVHICTENVQIFKESVFICKEKLYFNREELFILTEGVTLMGHRRKPFRGDREAKLPSKLLLQIH